MIILFLLTAFSQTEIKDVSHINFKYPMCEYQYVNCIHSARFMRIANMATADEICEKQVKYCVEDQDDLIDLRKKLEEKKCILF